jgi:adenosylmethionine-8-amino-7-oxononanoate aminotransferase
MGTVLAAELKSPESGYGNPVGAEFCQKLLKHGVFARPLGTVVYMMVSLNSEPKTIKKLCSAFNAVLEEMHT